MTWRLFAAALLALSVAGCAIDIARVRAVTAGHTGCVPDDIEITNIRDERGVSLWNATCAGKVYLCSALAGRDANDIACTPAAAPAAAH